MNRIPPKRWLQPISLVAIGAGLLISAGAATQAQARVFVGFGFPLFFGPPVYAPPPVYYRPPIYYPPPAYYPAYPAPPNFPPPAYYPPPPATYAPPPAYTPQATPAGQSCYAGPAVCPMENPVVSGSACYCTVNGQRVWGHAN